MVYTVKKGDTLTGIVLKLKLCQKGPGATKADWMDCVMVAKDLAKKNGIENPDRLEPGQRLIIGGGDGELTLKEAVMSPAVVGVIGLLGLYLLLAGSSKDEPEDDEDEPPKRKKGKQPEPPVKGKQPEPPVYLEGIRPRGARPRPRSRA